MANIVADNLFNLSGATTLGSPVTITLGWNDRLAGTAFVESDPMDGFVIALSLNGPTIVGSSVIDAEGNWEITGIASRHDGESLIVIGVPRNASYNLAMASRITTV